MKRLAPTFAALLVLALPAAAVARDPLEEDGGESGEGNARRAR